MGPTKENIGHASSSVAPKVVKTGPIVPTDVVPSTPRPTNVNVIPDSPPQEDKDVVSFNNIMDACERATENNELAHLICLGILGGSL